MNIGQLASLGKYSRAKVVFPVPFGPAIMMTFFIGLDVGQFFQKRPHLGLFLPFGKGCRPDAAWQHLATLAQSSCVPDYEGKMNDCRGSCPLFLPVIFQCHRSVKYRFASHTIYTVRYKITVAFKLVNVASTGFLRTLFQLRSNGGH